MTTELTERQQAEKAYHDKKYSAPDAAESVGRTTLATRRFWELVGRPSGLTILDFGCGNGWLAVQFAKRGNKVYGFDISGVLIERARQFAAESDVSHLTVFKEMAAEHLDFPEHSFDRVIGNSILHHTDLEITLSKIARVLKQDGTALFLEPLNQNPVLRAWRLLTPWRRTATERALTNADLTTIQRFFPATRFHYFCFTSMLSTGLLVAAPNSRVLAALDAALERLDERIVAAFPALGRLFAIVVMELRKGPDA